MNFDLPLVSFCLKAYNQKEFIGEALEGALGQTYRPLEIVICDDHSTDGTWELICERLGVSEKELGDRSQELVVGGSERGVRVVLHRNETNFGNCKNWEMCGKLAHGELLIKADGDDVSLPERTTKIVEAWVKDGKRAKVVSHGCEVIDTKDRALGVRNDIDVRRPHGACMAWSRECFVGWPEVQTKFAYDDIVYSFRARLLGGELVLPENLVRYRVGSGDTSVAGEYRGPLTRRCRGFLDAIPQCRRDLEWAREKGSRTVDEVAGELDELERINGAWIEILEGRTLWGRAAGARRVWKHHGFRGHVLIVLLILPFRMGDIVINLLLRRKNGGVRA